MHRSEIREITVCSDCGAEFSPQRERGYAFGNEGALCWTCAIRRGGTYDEGSDRWATAPDIRDLPEDPR